MRNLAAIRESPDLPARKLGLAYAELTARRALRRPPARARLLDHEVEYADFDALVSLFLEIFVRRHYPFRPTGPRPLVVDGGANIGVATLFFKAVAPDARVLAFEPEPTAYQLLCANVEHNRLTDVLCRRIALAAASGEAALHVPAPAHGGATTRPPVADWPVVTVVAEPLSAQLEEHVDFLKLDIEGGELEVLEELQASGKLELVHELALEFHPAAPDSLPRLLELLAEADFRYRIAAGSDAFWDPSQLLLIHGEKSS